jgi:CRP-like cAMP-binding protein
MLEGMRVMVSAPNDVLVTAGFIPLGLFIILEGECVRCREASGGPIMSFHKGEFFGEEVVADVPATHRVIARVACNLHVLVATEFHKFLKRFPDLRQEILSSQHKMQYSRSRKVSLISSSDSATQPIRSITRHMTTNLKDLRQSSFRERTSSRSRPPSRATSKKDFSFISLPDSYSENRQYDILTLKAEWLIEQYRSGGRLKRRQDIPSIAFCRGQIKHRAIISISYCWCPQTATHAHRRRAATARAK